MVDKTSKSGVPYRIEGRRFTWSANHHDPDDDFPAFDITLPLRMKLGTVLDAGAAMDMSTDQMLGFIERLIPGQVDKVREMDLNDFQDMFTEWQGEYSKLTGASLGESGGSSK